MKRFLTMALALCLTVCLFSGLSLTADAVISPEADKNVVATHVTAPVNPNASKEAKNLLAYMQSLRDTSEFVVGQFDISTNDLVWNNIKAQYGVSPALYSNRYILISDGPDKMNFSNVDAANALLKKHYDEGGMVVVHADWCMEVLAAAGRESGNFLDSTDMVTQLDETNPDRDKEIYALWNTYIDNYIAALRKLEASGVKAYFIRAFVEFNCTSFWGVSPEGVKACINVQKQWYKRFAESGLTGWLMMYCPGTGLGETYTKCAGNDYYDAYAITLYGDGGYDGTMAPGVYEDYDWYCRTGKPLGYGELSCRSNGYSMRNSWFNTLVSMIERWPRASFALCWGNDDYSLQGADENGYLSAATDDGKAFMRSPFAVTLDDLPDYQHGDYTVPGVVQIFKGKNAAGAYVGLDERVYTAAELKKMGISRDTVGSLRVHHGFGITFYAGDNATGRHWSYVTTLLDANGFTEGQEFASLKVDHLSNIAVGLDGIYASDNDGNAYKANDGMDSCWRADGDSGWLELDLEQAYTISRCVVRHAGSVGEAASYNTKDFCLQYSLDGENWITVNTVTDNTLGITDREFDAFTAQHVRLLITAPNSADGIAMAISEWELYGLPTSLGDLPEEEGLYKIDGEWVYIKDGAIQKDFYGFVKHKDSGVWFYVTDGKINWNLDGAFKHPTGVWFIVKGGQIDWGYNGFYKVNGVWFYFENGQINWNLTGLFKHPSGTWFYVQNAQINWTYTGFGKHLASGTWFYCENGSIAWNKSGAFKHPSGAWFVVKAGQIDWSYTGLYKANGVWFYFRNGQLDWGYTGKCAYGGQWFNVRNGQVVF